MARDRKAPAPPPAEPCRLYLIVPGGIGADFVDPFEAALDAGDVASVLLPAQMDEALAARLKDSAQARGVAVLIEGDAALARRLGADGVHVDANDPAYAQARAALGDDGIVGTGAGLSRHAGLTAGEAGADYVAFGPGGDDTELAELIGWWAEVVEVPCVAWDVASLEQARALAALGADFVAAGSLVWNHPASPADAVRELSGAIARAKDAA